MFMEIEPELNRNICLTKKEFNKLKTNGSIWVYENTPYQAFIMIE